MKTRATRAAAPSPEPSAEAQAVEDQMRRTFMPAVVDELRARTGYNPRQRHGTAFRLMLTVVEGFLAGQTLTFASLRAIFVRRFGFIRSCPFQKRFKEESAAAFFREALKHFVDSVVRSAGLTLTGPLGRFGKRYDEVRLEAACKRALLARARSYRHVESILKNGLDRVTTTEDTTTVPLTHENVRGRDYYH
jgi:hypothetical protein